MAYSRDDPLPPEYEFTNTPKEVQNEANRLAPFEVMAGIRIHGFTGGTPRYVRLLCSEAIKVRAITAEKSPQSERFNISTSIVQLAWDSLLRKKEVPTL